MKNLRAICLLLALALVLVPVLSACSEEKTESSAASQEAATSEPDLSTEYTDREGNYIWKTSGKDWSSLKTFTVLTAGVNADYDSEIVYNVYEKNDSGNMLALINDQLKMRSEKLEELIGVTVEEKYILDEKRYGGAMANYIRDGNMLNTEEYQVVAPCLYDGGALAVEGQLRNLYELEELGLQIRAPWWNQTFNESMTMAGQLYITIGDIGLINKDATAALLFNLDFWNRLNLSDNYGGRNPYQLVRDGDWTIDVAFETARAVDPTSLGAVDDPIEGVFGWGGQLDDMWSIFFASGEKIAKAGSDGYPELTMYNERSATLMDKLQDFVNDSQHYISGNKYFGYKGERWPMVLVCNGFVEGRALYYNASIGTVNQLKDMAEHYGVVPVPKMDSIQDDYYSLINPWVSNCFAIPLSTTGDYLAMTIDALNIIGAYSGNTIAKDYDQTVLQYMRSKDADTPEMIFNYILPNRSCDIGMVYKWGDLDSLLQQMASKPIGTFLSNYDAKSEAAQTALDETVDQFKANAERAGK